jgi:hypothetical protein
MAKISDSVARELMLKNNLNPLEAYPGNHKPWQCECLTCGRTVSPHYSSVQQGRKGCAYCAGRKVDPIEAIEIMQLSQLQPLEDYPGSHAKWKSKCLGCQEIVYPQYSNIRQGWGGCKKCAGLIIEPFEAKRFYESFGLCTSEEYPGAHQPWRGTCLNCNNEIAPRYSDLKNGKSKGCEYCGGSKVNPIDALNFMTAKGFRTSISFPGGMIGWKGNCIKCENEIFPRYSAVKAGQGICKFCAGKALSKRDALNLLINANLEPLEEYKNAGFKIKCKCLGCNRIVDARLYGIAQGEGGCAYCAGRKIDAEEAVLRMLECGFEVLVKYPGSKLPWKSKCIECGNISSPSYGNVNLLGSGCIFCNRDNGAFDGSTSGLFYLITNTRLNSHKVGITSSERKSDRLKVHKGSGWETFKILEFKNGSEALRVESETLDWLRLEMNLGPYLSKEEMPQGGHSETVDASEIDLPTIWAKVVQLSKVKK